MAVDLVMAAISAVVKIKGELEKFRRNNDECDTIYGLVDTVGRDLMLLKDAPMMEDAAVHPVMERLKYTLERTAAEAVKCQSSSALIRFFRTDDVAAMLEQLRQDISEKMLGLVLAATVGTNTLVQGIGQRMDQNFEFMHQEMHRVIYAALAALLLPLQNKLELLEQRTTDHTTDDARIKNKAVTEKAGPIKYTWSALEASLTSNEDIGGGHISTVYKGELNKIPVAIKKFHNVNQLMRECFVDELRFISKLQHENIIELLGHCYEYSETLVQEGNGIQVYKNGHLGFVSPYMPNQSLVRIIKGDQPVDWPTLFRIIQGIAKGVHYLHEQRVVHFDLKPKTILLDANMTPRINDFGRAKELVPGGDEITLDTDKLLLVTEGYMAPELSSDKPRGSTKSDVYSFGIILLETISLMCAASEKGRPRGPEEWLNRTQGTELRDLFDHQLVDDESLMVATRCVLVGLMCCLPDPAGRPSMLQVVDMLASSCGQQENSKNIPSSSNTGQGLCLNCGEERHQPVPCEIARAWLDRSNSQRQASPDDEALDKAICDMDEFKSLWLGNMATTLGTEVTGLSFLTEAYEEIAECRRRIGWVHAYAFYYLEPLHHRNNQWDLFERLLGDANGSLVRLHDYAMEVRLTLCTTEVEAITEMFLDCKKIVMDLTIETRHHCDKLVEAAETDFLD